ncbi:MAG: filamentous hemagglutinin N-terminal domain-containing protein [Symploca sp. SIO2E9]|nr:filamentous hemagglutinin N-terminal domain-containing protein [Symploca sp. SIO2E9]
MVKILNNYLTIAGAIPLIACLAYTCFTHRALAQLTPDTSLGNENSVVTPNVDVQGELADLIEGGAIRDLNLFHSFLEFNVENGGRVYFANPAGIENILTRVTGNNASNILGTLGVDGAANLFLLNPNGIVFGNNAQLDVEGSFMGSTANSLVFGDGSEFSATDSGVAPLLTVSVPVGLQYGANPTGDIANSGNLAAGQDLTLVGNNLDLQGQLLAGGDLKLQAENTLKIRDSLDNPFIAAAGGELVIQGNESVDIFALNHPDSGLFSGGNLILRSLNSISGDAHYWSGGSFRIEKLDGSLGDLESPYDPVIRSFGDVSFNNYFGASLHILAGGSVNIGTVIITEPETGSVGDNFLVEEITLSDGTLVSINGGEQPTLDVRAGVSPQAIGTPGITGFDGFPTDFFADAGFNFLEPPPETNTAATSADITIDAVGINAPDGLIFLTNQYQPNTSLPGGDINITGAGLFGFDIFTASDQGNSGDVILDSRQNIALTNANIDSSASTLDAGNITLLAQEAVSITNSSMLANTSGAGNGGDITISSKRLIADGVNILTDSTGEGTGGNLGVFASESVTLKGINADTEFPSFLLASTSGTGEAGDITINTRELLITDGATVSVSTSGEGAGGTLTIETEKLLIADGAIVRASTFREGKGGELRVFASEEVQVIGTSADGELSSSLSNSSLGKGDAGSLTIETGNLLIANGANVTTSTFGEGKGGELKVFASEQVQVIGESADGQFTGVLSSESNGQGDAGSLTIETGKLLIANGSRVSTSTFGEGKGGELRVFASEQVQIIGTSADGESSSSFSSISGGKGDAGDLTIETGKLLITDGANVSAATAGEGDAGDLTIKTGKLLITDGASVSTATVGEGNGGNLIVNASESVQVIGTSADGESSSILSSRSLGKGDAGDLTIETGKLLITDGADVSTTTFGEGTAGELRVFASEEVQLMGTSADGELPTFLSSESQAGSTGDAGDLTIETGKLLITDGAQVITGTFGAGKGGDLRVFASEEVQVMGRAADGQIASILSSQSDGKGDAGDLTIETGKLFIANGANVSTGTFAQGDGGELKVFASEEVQVIGRSGDGQFPTALSSQSATGSTGNAGDLTIETGKLLIADGANVGAGTFAQGDGGELNVFASESVQVIAASADSEFSSALGTQSEGKGDAGDLTINTRQLLVAEGGFISAASVREGEGGNLFINASEKVQVTGATADGEFFSTIRTISIEEGAAGNLNINTKELLLTDGAQVSARSEGIDPAGNITLNIDGLLSATDGDITTNASQSAGGAINITAQDIQLFGDSDIKTNVSSGSENGGDINITADSIIAFDDSDILAFARDGKGGDITFKTIAFFAENYRPAPEGTNPETLDGNNRVDINASGGIDGVITLPDVSFIQNSLTDLPDEFVNPDSLIAGSCIIPTNQQQGSLFITGAGGFPIRPGDMSVAPFPTGIVKPIGSSGASADSPNSVSRTNRRWQKGDPILEPTGVYQLPSGRLVMGRECF